MPFVFTLYTLCNCGTFWCVRSCLLFRVWLCHKNFGGPWATARALPKFVLFYWVGYFITHGSLGEPFCPQYGVMLFSGWLEPLMVWSVDVGEAACDPEPHGKIDIQGDPLRPTLAPKVQAFSCTHRVVLPRFILLGELCMWVCLFLIIWGQMRIEEGGSVRVCL
jgi:hypothetical protein